MEIATCPLCLAILVHHDKAPSTAVILRINLWIGISCKRTPCEVGEQHLKNSTSGKIQQWVLVCWLRVAGGAVTSNRFFFPRIFVFRRTRPPSHFALCSPPQTAEAMVNRVLQRRKLRNSKGKHGLRDALELSWTRDKARDTRTLLQMPTKVNYHQQQHGASV